jgi:dienelactone hydrolase
MKLKTIALAFSGLLFAGVGVGVYHVQTEYGGIGLPWVNSLDLPPFPDYPKPQTTLNETQRGEIYFESKSPYDFSVLLNRFERAPATTGKGVLHLPEAASASNPVPAMIILHGSGGLAEGREDRYAKLYTDNGYAAFVLDYYEPRGATPELPYHLKVLTTTESDLLVDAYSALKLLNTHPAIDAERIGVTGYSYGGMASRYAMDPRIKAIVAPDVPPFAVHVDTYGPCHQNMGKAASTGGAYLALKGDQDASIDLDVCRQIETELKAYGSHVESHVFAGAGHAWENASPRRLSESSPYVSECRFSFDDQGFPTVDGEAVSTPPADASRGERALARAMILLDVPHCIKRGYIIGRDDDTDRRAKVVLLDFLERHLKGDYQASTQ